MQTDCSEGSLSLVAAVGGNQLQFLPGGMEADAFRKLGFSVVEI